MRTNFWPRHAALEILRLETKEQRNQYLQKHVPEPFRAMTRKYVEIWWPNREKIINDSASRLSK